MSTPSKNEPRPARQKLTINLSNQSATRLRTLAERREETLNDCVEAALNVFNYLVQARLDGYTILLQHQTDGTQRELVLLDLPDPIRGESSERTSHRELPSRQVAEQIVEALLQRLSAPDSGDQARAALATLIPTTAKQ